MPWIKKGGRPKGKQIINILDIKYINQAFDIIPYKSLVTFPTDNEILYITTLDSPLDPGDKTVLANHILRGNSL